jgi:hypothetical protein
MHVQRLPRRLWYRWSEGGVETEYATDIPTPVPEIKCDEILVEVPPIVPNSFELFGSKFPGGQIVRLAVIYSFTPATIGNVFNYPDGIRQEVNLQGTNIVGQVIQGIYFGQIIYRNAYFITPPNTLKPRRDLVIGGDRIINPTVEAPCPKWRFTGGNCPPGSQDCGNCCLDCAALVAGIDGLTAAVKAMVRR